MIRRYRALILMLASAVALVLPGCSMSKNTGEAGSMLLALLVALVAAKLGGELFVRLKQPAVLGELVLGIVVGNLVLFGYHGLQFIGSDPAIDALAELGVVILLFQVGLDSDLGETMRVGGSAFLVAVFGVLAPLLLGWGAAALLIPEAGTYAHIFIGATLCATSIAITARVLRDVRKTRSKEGRIILGAAVIDDVLGLIILAAIQGAITAASSGHTLPPWQIPLVVLKAVVFLIATPFAGRKLAPMLFRFVARFKADDLLLVTALAICFGFAYLADLIGLAPIVGAFAAGLVLEEAHWRRFLERGEHSLDQLLAPLIGFLAPIFFFRMGIGVDLGVLAHPRAWLLAIALTAAALLGKQACGLGVWGKRIDRLSVGIGMMPRGEVGLIFAAIGAKLVIDGRHVLEPDVFSALIITIIFTTVVTPPLLKWSLCRNRQTEEHTSSSDQA